MIACSSPQKPCVQPFTRFGGLPYQSRQFLSIRRIFILQFHRASEASISEVFVPQRYVYLPRTALYPHLFGGVGARSRLARMPQTLSLHRALVPLHSSCPNSVWARELPGNSVSCRRTANRVWERGGYSPARIVGKGQA